MNGTRGDPPLRRTPPILPSVLPAILLAGAAAVCSACVRLPAPSADPPDRPIDARAASSRFRFTDVATSAGLERVLLAGRPGKDHLLDSAGSGVAFLDYDRDGRLDVYLVNGWRLEGNRVIERGRNALYRGLPDGTFRDVTDAAGVAGGGLWGAGVTVADYDADGRPDLFVTNFGPNVLYRNLGDGRFANVAPAAGVEAPGWNTAASFFDADGDGDLDLYVAAYIQASLDEVLEARATLDWKGLEKVAVGPFGMEGAPDHFFRQEQGGRFADATDAAGLEDRGLGYGFATRAADFDGDGDLDLYVANDSDPNYLYRNEGNGRFRDVGLWSGCALDANGSAQASMGIAAGDTRHTGRLDIFVTHFSEDFSTLYHNLGGGLFEDATAAAGVGQPTWRPLSWGTAFGDLDNDGDLDLVIANGHIYPQIDRHPEVIGAYRQRNLLLENVGDRFRDATDGAGPGFRIVESSRGLALGDYDNDGDLDILISNLDAPPSLLRNDTRGGSWITLILEDDRGGTIPVGAVVTVDAGGIRQVRDVAAGDSYAGTHDPRPHFGLGDAAQADLIEVRWPDGRRTILKDVPARQFLTIRPPG